MPPEAPVSKQRLPASCRRIADDSPQDDGSYHGVVVNYFIHYHHFAQIPDCPNWPEKVPKQSLPSVLGTGGLPLQLAGRFLFDLIQFLFSEG
jgi:hypothetical protein